MGLLDMLADTAGLPWNALYTPTIDHGENAAITGVRGDRTSARRRTWRQWSLIANDTEAIDDAVCGNTHAGHRDGIEGKTCQN
jgi:hypothetical protein